MQSVLQGGEPKLTGRLLWCIWTLSPALPLPVTITKKSVTERPYWEVETRALKCVIFLKINDLYLPMEMLDFDKQFFKSWILEGLQTEVTVFLQIAACKTGRYFTVYGTEKCIYLGNFFLFNFLTLFLLFFWKLSHIHMQTHFFPEAFSTDRKSKSYFSWELHLKAIFLSAINY